jgi:hypothetical protein
MTPNRDAICKAFDQSFGVYRFSTFVVTRVRTLQAVQRFGRSSWWAARKQPTATTIASVASNIALD